MTRVGLLSDTHGWLDPSVFEHLKDCDEVWHAGDFGAMSIIRDLAAWKPFIGVWGNIDSPDIRRAVSENAIWMCEGVKVFMTHIGGYPGRYAPRIKPILEAEKPKLFISGHSHILKVIHDPKLDCLHMNPGAFGKHGWHSVRTLLRFTVDGEKMKDLEVVELPK